MLWNSEVLRWTEALTNFPGVVAIFPESAVVVELIVLPAIGEKTVEMAARMTVVVEIAALRLGRVESS
jgi:hypothetical protein